MCIVDYYSPSAVVKSCNVEIVSIGSEKEKRETDEIVAIPVSSQLRLLFCRFWRSLLTRVWGAIAVGAAGLCGEWFRVIWVGGEGFGGMVSSGGVVA